jgi:hypothetical protein
MGATGEMPVARPLAGSGDDADRFRLRAFLTLGDGELDFLALEEGFEAGALNGAEVRKYVRAGRLFDETETLAFVKPLYFASCSGHEYFLLYINHYPIKGGQT